ncbi:MAG: hypothetical protein ACK58T_33450, partial [Phycisphaerae bacterium]
DATTYIVAGGELVLGDYSTYALSWTTLCGTRSSAPVVVYELDAAESGVGFDPESSAAGGVIFSPGFTGPLMGSVVRLTASAGGSTGGGFGFAAAAVLATITPQPYGSMLEITCVSAGAENTGGSAEMVLVLEVDERTAWTVEPSGTSAEVRVYLSDPRLLPPPSSATSGVIRPSQPVFVKAVARPNVPGTFVWRMAMARDPRVVDVPLGPFNDPRWEISRVNALGEEWFVPATQSGNPPAIEVFSLQPTSAVGCG